MQLDKQKWQNNSYEQVKVSLFTSWMRKFVCWYHLQGKTLVMHIVSEFEGFLTVPPIRVQHVVKCPVFFAVQAMKKCIETCNSPKSTTKHKDIHWPKNTSQNCSCINQLASGLDLQKFCRRCHHQWCQSAGKYRFQHLTSTPLRQCKARPQNARNMAGAGRCV